MGFSAQPLKIELGPCVNRSQLPSLDLDLSHHLRSSTNDWKTPDTFRQHMYAADLLHLYCS